MRFFCVFVLIALAFPRAQTTRAEVYQQAIAFYRSGDYARALTLFERVERWDERARDLQNYIHDCRLKLGLWVDAARPVWDSWDSVPLKFSRDSLRLAYNQALHWLNGGDATRARILAHRLLQQNPADSAYAVLYRRATLEQSRLRELYLNLAHSFDREGSYRLALQELRKAEYYSDPEDSYIRMVRADIENRARLEQDFLLAAVRAARARGDWPAQIFWLDQAMRNYPDHPELRRIQDSTLIARGALMRARIEDAKMLYYSGQSAEALNAFESLARDFPEQVALRYWVEEARILHRRKTAVRNADSLNRALTQLLDQKRYAQAGRVFRELRALYQASWDAFPGMRDSSFAQTEWKLQQQAIQELGRAERLLNAKNYREALTAAENAQAMAPQSGFGEALIAKIRAEQAAQAQMMRERVERVEKLVAAGDFAAIAPEDWQSTGDPALDRRLALARQNIKTASVNEKIDEANRARAAALFDRGLQYYRLGDYARAAAVWESVLQLDPKHPKASGYLDNVRKKMR